MDKCVFCKIVKGEIPTQVIYQDKMLMVFPDLHPKAPLHLLVIPKAHVSDFSQANDELILALRKKIIDLVDENSLMTKGYRVIVNGGMAMAIPHLHFHLLGGVGIEREV